MTVNSVEERILAAARYKLNMDEKVIQAGMFNNRSTGSERRQLLQSILRADDQEEEEEEDETPDDETINQMIARSNDEFEKFQTMDIERRRQEAALGSERKPRLIEECELPDFLLQEIDEEEEAAEEEAKRQQEMELGRGNRQKKDMSYDDKMSEKEWLKAIGAEDEDYESSEEEDATPKKRGRGRKKRGRDDDSDDEDFHIKKKKSEMKKLQKKMRKLLDIVIAYEDQDGRLLSEPFMKLPTRKELPDYYEVIRKPVDISKMLTKINDGKVQSK